MLSHNMYAYCNNNPINYEDENGAILNLIVNIISSIVNIFSYMAPKIEYETELEEPTFEADFIWAKFSITPSSKIATRNNNKGSKAYINTSSNGKVSVGTSIGKMSIEKSMFSSHVSLQIGKQHVVQYENEYILIDKVSYINIKEHENKTIATYYTFEINSLNILATMALGGASVGVIGMFQNQQAVPATY